MAPEGSRRRSRINVTCFSLAALLFKRSLLLPAGIAIAAAALWGQSNSSIIGTVTDQANAVVPHAAVTVTEDATGAVHKAQTNETGVFQILDLLPGEYSVNVQLTGFKALEIHAVALDTSQSRDPGKLKLALGAVSSDDSYQKWVAITSTWPALPWTTSICRTDSKLIPFQPLGALARISLNFSGEDAYCPALLVPGMPSPATTTAISSVISLRNLATIA